VGGEPEAQPDLVSVAEAASSVPAAASATQPAHHGDVLDNTGISTGMTSPSQVFPGRATPSGHALLRIAHPADSEVAAHDTDRWVSSPSAQAQQQGVERSEPEGQRVPLVRHRLEDRAEAPTTGHRASRGSSTCRPAGDPIARYVRARNVCARVQPS
jgi:hypothetical protein